MFSSLSEHGEVTRATNVRLLRSRTRVNYNPYYEKKYYLNKIKILHERETKMVAGIMSIAMVFALIVSVMI